MLEIAVQVQTGKNVKKETEIKESYTLSGLSEEKHRIEHIVVLGYYLYAIFELACVS